MWIEIQSDKRNQKRKYKLKLIMIIVAEVVQHGFKRQVN